MKIRITEAGIMDTIQDDGRYGYAASGINPGGAMDQVAANVANYLVGNTTAAAVVEMHYPACSFRFENDGLIALSGADFSPLLDEQPVPLNTPLIVKAGSELRFTRLRWGARCYMAANSGFKLNKWLDSYSTNLKAGSGGFEGRRLQKNDLLVTNADNPFQSPAASLPWHADVAMFYGNEKPIRIVAGKEYACLTECSTTIIEGNTFIVSAQSDRMGYRMNGSPLQLQDHHEMLSSAVTRGTIQLLPNGQLIILMADHQTTGGYPRIAHVITADLPMLAQVQLNTSVRFQLVSIEAATSLLIHQQQQLQQIKSACLFRLEE